MACKKTAQKYDLDVIFGVEEHLYGGLEILCYGITTQFLYDNPQLVDHQPEEWYKACHNFGAVCIQAHPYRDRSYISEPKVIPLEYIDGIEIYNLGNKPEENSKAQDFYAAHHNLIVTSGADAHEPQSVCIAGIETDTRLKDEKDLVYVLKTGKYKLITD